MTAINLPAKSRVSSIDLMRGIVMVIMALDHTRDFFHESAFAFDPTDPQKASVALFFTRWITHYCAPTFVFLSGTSIWLNLQRKSKKEMSRFLLTRGLWLMFLEFTVIRFSFFFNLYYDFTVIQVIYALAMSMILMAGLIYLSQRTLLILGFLIVGLHNVLDYFPVGPDNTLFGLLTFIYQGGPIQIAEGKFAMVGYPFLPWLGILLLGFSIGPWYASDFDPKRRQILLLRTGLVVMILFIALRYLNIYGDPAPWYVGADFKETVLSFLNASKYPVSLIYTLMTLGPVLVIMSFLTQISTIGWKPVEVFGRVPLFYYIVHFYTIHILSIAFFLIFRHKSFSDLNFHFSTGDNFLAGPGGGGGYFGGVPIGAGYSLWVVYLVWISVVLMLYPLCKKYNAYKSSHTNWWLSYL